MENFFNEVDSFMRNPIFNSKSSNLLFFVSINKLSSFFLKIILSVIKKILGLFSIGKNRAIK